MTNTTPAQPDQHHDAAPKRENNESDWVTVINREESDREWQATTDEAFARIDNTLLTLANHVSTIDDDYTRGRIIGVLGAVLTTLENLTGTSPDALPDNPGAPAY